MLRLCAPDEVAEGQSRGFEVAGEKVFAVRKDGQLYAYRNRCKSLPSAKMSRASGLS